MVGTRRYTGDERVAAMVLALRTRFARHCRTGASDGIQQLTHVPEVRLVGAVPDMAPYYRDADAVHQVQIACLRLLQFGLRDVLGVGAALGVIALAIWLAHPALAGLGNWNLVIFFVVLLGAGGLDSDAGDAGCSSSTAGSGSSSGSSRAGRSARRAQGSVVPAGGRAEKDVAGFLRVEHDGLHVVHVVAGDAFAVIALEVVAEHSATGCACDGAERAGSGTWRATSRRRGRHRARVGGRCVRGPLLRQLHPPAADHRRFRRHRRSAPA